MSAMANMRIGKRLMLGFGALTVLMLVMTGVSIWAQNALSEMDEATLQSETQVYLAARAQRDVIAVILSDLDARLKPKRAARVIAAPAQPRAARSRKAARAG